ncbi:MAG: NAD(P)H-binding protein [Treponema sp.]|jgi:putative NADH-flavin reductase|nr:NAD(P)H-binding protein [Treponema sp.]
MKIGVIGATGKAGRLIANEAANRGHEVTAIIRPGSAGRLEQSYKILERDIFNLKAEDIRGFDVVVSAFGTPFNKPGAEYLHQTAMESLIREMEQLPEVRLLCVGGASSLWEDREQTRRVLESIPRDWRAAPENQVKAFEKLKASKVNWTYLSPPKNFDAAGTRTGKYMIGTDYVILNSAGESYGTYADYAVAMVDEIENKAYIRRRFTIVSDPMFFQDGKRLFSVANFPFFRKGGYFGVYLSTVSDDSYGSAELFFGSRRGTAPEDSRLFNFAPTYNGKKVACAVQAMATELTIRTRHGNLYLCFAESSLLLIKGDQGMGIRLNRTMTSHQQLKPRGANAWESVMGYSGCMVYRVLKGQGVSDSPWVWDELSTPRVQLDVNPDSDSSILLAVEEFPYAGWVRDSYPNYEEGLESAQKDWESFLATIPHFPIPFEEKRELAAYALWSHIVGPSGRIKRPYMYMFPAFSASSWQQCFNAVALGSIDMSLSTELLLNMLDQQSPVGQLPDFYDDSRLSGAQLKPPIQGWALKLLMKKHDLARAIPKDKLETLYSGFAIWGDWFMKYRDDDHDGLPQYDCGDESGCDDGTVFKYGKAMETPDLCAELALLWEALGDIAKMLGKDAEEAEGWYRRSKDMIGKMIETFWNGERFVALVNGTHEVVATDSCEYYLPIILGKRLPQEIIDKLAMDLSVEGDLLTPYGLASEKLSTSDELALGMHMARAYVLPPYNMLIITGLSDAGKQELARKIALRYCQTVKDGGFIMLINPFMGGVGMSGGSWTACAYIILSELLLK